MSDPEEQVGPIDYLVVEYPAGEAKITGAAARELLALVDAGTVRVLDLIFLHKDEDGGITVDEFEDVEGLADLAQLGAGLAEVLAEEDLYNLAAAIEPGSTAAVLVWENTWATPFAVALRESGAQLVANGRIPMQALVASMSVEGD